MGREDRDVRQKRTRCQREQQSAALTRDGESARPPAEAFSSSIEGGTHLALSETSGLILILNFFLLSSSSSESLEEKSSFPLEAGECASRTLSSAFTPSPNCFYLKTERILWASSAGCRLKPSSSTSGEAWQREPGEMSAVSTPASYFMGINVIIDCFFVFFGLDKQLPENKKRLTYLSQSISP